MKQSHTSVAFSRASMTRYDEGIKNMGVNANIDGSDVAIKITSNTL